MDFMHDRLNSGHCFRLFSVLDNFNRAGLGIKVDLSLQTVRVIRCDNGPEYHQMVWG